MATLREVKNKEVRIFFCELKKGNICKPFHDQPIRIRSSFTTMIIIEARITYFKELMLNYFLRMYDRRFYWEFEDTELLDRLVNHLNRHKGRSLDEALDSKFR